MSGIKMQAFLGWALASVVKEGGGRLKAQSSDSAALAAPPLPSYGLTPLSSAASRQVQWLPAASSLPSPGAAKLAQISPRCFLKLSFSLPLLLPPRISICASVC